MLLSEAFRTPYASWAPKLALPGVDISAFAKAALGGVDTSAVMREAVQAMGTSAAMKATLAGIGTPAFMRATLAGVDTSAWFKIIDVDLVVNIASAWLEAERAAQTMPSSDAVVTPLSRDQVRLLLGWYVYAVTWLLVLKFIVDVMGVSDIAAAILGLMVTMTGVSGNSVASRARTIGLRVFDRMYPPKD
jgi:hypothetical protein